MNFTAKEERLIDTLKEKLGINTFEAMDIANDIIAVIKESIINDLSQGTKIGGIKK